MGIKYVLDYYLNFARVGGFHMQDSGINLLNLL